jgi:hypothetical protein
MAEIVNLRRARKAQERMRRQAIADEARLKHGRSASKRALAQKERDAARIRLDGHKIETGNGNHDERG